MLDLPEVQTFFFHKVDCIGPFVQKVERNMPTNFEWHRTGGFWFRFRIPGPLDPPGALGGGLRRLTKSTHCTHFNHAESNGVNGFWISLTISKLSRGPFWSSEHLDPPEVQTFGSTRSIVWDLLFRRLKVTCLPILNQIGLAVSDLDLVPWTFGPPWSPRGAQEVDEKYLLHLFGPCWIQCWNSFFDISYGIQVIQRSILYLCTFGPPWGSNGWFHKVNCMGPFV